MNQQHRSELCFRGGLRIFCRVPLQRRHSRLEDRSVWCSKGKKQIQKWTLVLRLFGHGLLVPIKGNVLQRAMILYRTIVCLQFWSCFLSVPKHTFSPTQRALTSKPSNTFGMKPGLITQLQWVTSLMLLWLKGSKQGFAQARFKIWCQAWNHKSGSC